jgi:molybdopterin synthase catalytic subunit
VSHSALRLVDLRETPLDVSEVVAALDDDASGGLTLFVGRVRDHDGGRSVDGLDYSAHPSARDRMREICERIATEYDVQGVAAVHRTGTLAIGDIAVVVATTAAHRGEAFAA